jgi:hypothetical protein
LNAPSLVNRISANRPSFFTPAQHDEWERAAIARDVLALRQEIALAEAKLGRLQASIETRKKSLARLEAQAVLTAPVRSAVTVNACFAR